MISPTALLEASGLPVTEENENGIMQEARRVLAVRHLIDFTCYTFPQYEPEPAHILMADHLDEVLAGNIDRLLILAPPQHGKTELVSVRFPAFWLANKPDDPIILTSYGASLAQDKSREARGVMESPMFEELYPEIRTDQTSRAKEHWKLENYRGQMIAAGVGGPVTGHGAALGIIDDPYENWQQAQSPTYRRRVITWWKGTFRTRILEGGAIVIVLTRWHEEDLAGYLLDTQGDNWTVLRLPAVSETQEHRDKNNIKLNLPKGEPDPLGRVPGEPLCPNRFNIGTLIEIKSDVGTRVWSAEYQGVPVPPEGNLVKREWFKKIMSFPDGVYRIRRVRYWDKAGTKDEGDFTVGILMAALDFKRGKKIETIYVVEDVIRGRWSIGNRDTRMLDVAFSDADKYGHIKRMKNREPEIVDSGPAIWTEQEGGSGGKESALATVALLSGFNVHKETVKGSKVTRAEPFFAQCEALKVFLIMAAWNEAYLEELCSFPFGANDDQVDGSSGAFSKLVVSQPGRSYHGLV